MSTTTLNRETIINDDMPQGTTYTLTLRWMLGTTPANLTGYSAAMQMRADYDDELPVVSLDNGDLGGIVLGGSAGTIEITVADTVTAALEPGKYRYDLELYSAAGTKRFCKGKMTVTPEVTRV